MKWTPNAFLTSSCSHLEGNCAGKADHYPGLASSGSWTLQRHWVTLSHRTAVCSLRTLLACPSWLLLSAFCCGMRALDQALEQVVHIEEGQAAPTNSTRLIHITGQLSSRQVAIDETYNISVAAVKLRRLVEVYQWVEKSTYRQYGDSDGISMEKDYAYELDWRSELVDCTSLTKVSCVNPMRFPVPSMDFVLSEVYLGQLQLSDSLISMIDNFHPLDAVITDQGNKNFLYLTESGGTPEKPKVGDMRISFLVAGILGPQGDKVSVVSECDGHHLHPFKSTAGASVELLEFGDVTAKVMFKQAYADNGLSTFLFRSIAWFVSFMGFSLLSPVLHIPCIRIAGGARLGHEDLCGVDGSCLARARANVKACGKHHVALTGTCHDVLPHKRAASNMPICRNPDATIWSLSLRYCNGRAADVNSCIYIYSSMGLGA
ncbi:transmembrane protein 43 isoform X2 [Dermacentor albipictus]|uniref:transmembrane protein 43 isoform X2 n=1 Tax=Dermacentor albipictus TaxID=60249 RepID=UPI0038FCC716